MTNSRQPTSRRVLLMTLCFLCLTLFIALPTQAGGRHKKKQPGPIPTIIAMKLAKPVVSGDCGKQHFDFESLLNVTTPTEVKWHLVGPNKALINGLNVNTSKTTLASLDASTLTPGLYVVTAEATDDATGCVSYDSAVIEINNCPPAPAKICFSEQSKINLALKSDNQAQAGEIVTVVADPHIDGGNVAIKSSWSTSVGTIKTNSHNEAQLDLTGGNPGQAVTVTYSVVGEVDNCKLKKELTFYLAPLPPEPVATELSTCTTFKFNNARVDNACKNILQDVARLLEKDPTARLILIGNQRSREIHQLGLQRANNVKTALSQGGINISIDENRITTKAGQANNNTVKVIFVPSGAKYEP